MNGPFSRLGFKSDGAVGRKLSASQFGLSTGQAAVSQAFKAQVFDSTGANIWDAKSPGVINLEGP